MPTTAEIREALEFTLHGMEAVKEVLRRLGDDAAVHINSQLREQLHILQAPHVLSRIGDSWDCCGRFDPSNANFVLVREIVSACELMQSYVDEAVKALSGDAPRGGA